MSKSNLTKYQDELLEILSEECAELIQEKSKIFRFGIDGISHHQIGKSHLVCLTQELGDILAMIQLVTESGIGVTEANLSQAMERKLEKIKAWMTNTPALPVFKEKETSRPKVKKKSVARKNEKAMVSPMEEVIKHDEAVAVVRTIEEAMAKTLELAQTELDNYKKDE